MSLATVENTVDGSGVPLSPYFFTCDACTVSRYSDTGALPHGWRALDTWHGQTHTVQHVCEACEKKSHAEPPVVVARNLLRFYIAIAIALLLGLALFSVVRRFL